MDSFSTFETSSSPQHRSSAPHRSSPQHRSSLLLKALVDDSGQSSIEALVVVAIMLHITLWFVVHLVMALYSAGLEMGVDSLDIAAIYGINGADAEVVNNSAAAKRLGHKITEINLPFIPMVIHESISASTPANGSLSETTSSSSSSEANAGADRTGLVNGKGNHMVRWMPAWQLQVNQCILEVYGRMVDGDLKGGVDADAAEKGKPERTKKKK